jgi:copper chaperone NosL
MTALWLRYVSWLPLLLLAGTSGCYPAPPYPIHFGGVECAYCHMIVSDPRFAAELVTKKGRVYDFDSLECVASFYAQNMVAHEEVHSIWVSDFAHPGDLIPASSALYLKAPRLRGPMGVGLAAFAQPAALAEVKARLGGIETSWQETLAASQGPKGQGAPP